MFGQEMLDVSSEKAKQSKTTQELKGGVSLMKNCFVLVRQNRQKNKSTGFNHFFKILLSLVIFIHIAVVICISDIGSIDIS